MVSPPSSVLETTYWKEVESLNRWIVSLPDEVRTAWGLASALHIQYECACKMFLGTGKNVTIRLWG